MARKYNLIFHFSRERVQGLAWGIAGHPVQALAQGWIAIDGNRPMDWSQARPKAGKAPGREKASQRPTDTATG